MKSGWWRAAVRARLLSPGGFLVRAAMLVLIFLVLHALGLRKYTTVVTGTSPTGSPVDAPSVMIALFYVVSHLGAVVVAPALALAGCLWAGWLGLTRNGTHRAPDSA